MGSRHDSAQNEAERTNAAIGEALATGRPAEPPADPFHGLNYGLSNGKHDLKRGLRTLPFVEGRKYLEVG